MTTLNNRIPRPPPIQLQAAPLLNDSPEPIKNPLKGGAMAPRP